MRAAIESVLGAVTDNPRHGFRSTRSSAQAASEHGLEVEQASRLLGASRTAEAKQRGCHSCYDAVFVSTAFRSVSTWSATKLMLLLHRRGGRAARDVARRGTRGT